MDKLQMSPRVAIALVVVLALILGLTMCGCSLPGGGSVDVSTPWGFSTITVFNSTSYTLMVLHDGKKTGSIAPGESCSVELTNLSGGTAVMSITVSTRQNGEVLSSTRSFYVYPQNRWSDTWEVQEWELR